MFFPELFLLHLLKRKEELCEGLFCAVSCASCLHGQCHCVFFSLPVTVLWVINSFYRWGNWNTPLAPLSNICGYSYHYFNLAVWHHLPLLLFPGVVHFGHFGKDKSVINIFRKLGIMRIMGASYLCL